MNNLYRVASRPFFILGGQVHNSSAYRLQDLEPAWKALKLLHANTAEIPVYWEQVEPQEGVFDFTNLDQIITAARERGLRLVLLWFATWKNGSMQYAPGWVKNNPVRFQRVKAPAGNQLWVLSSHCQENLEADRRAYCALLTHLKQVDGDQGTVIALQIENEPGILGAARDYNPEAEREYKARVPAELLTNLKRSPVESPLRFAWEQAGSRRGGAWETVFGEQAPEYFSAWSIAGYINQLALAGKQIYPLPVYVNVWLGENGWWLPGESYPSGGAVSWVLDLWKWAAPDIDLIAPDIYLQDSDAYRSVCSLYSRLDNPLFIPESGGTLSNAVNLFEAIADFNAVGYAVFGIESLLGLEDQPKPESLALVESFRCVASVIPLIELHQGSSNIYSVVQHEFASSQRLDLGEYLGLAAFNDSPLGSWERTDFRHTPIDRGQRGRGLIIKTGPREFFLTGAGYRLLLKKKVSDRLEFSRAHDHWEPAMLNYVRVEEGHFDTGRSWQVDRLRNGDEITGGAWVAPDCGVIRVELTEE